jgi:hypothetical protein
MVVAWWQIGGKLKHTATNSTLLNYILLKLKPIKSAFSKENCNNNIYFTTLTGLCLYYYEKVVIKKTPKLGVFLLLVVS